MRKQSWSFNGIGGKIHLPSQKKSCLLLQITSCLHLHMSHWKNDTFSGFKHYFNFFQVHVDDMDVTTTTYCTILTQEHL